MSCAGLLAAFISTAPHDHCMSPTPQWLEFKDERVWGARLCYSDWVGPGDEDKIQ